MRLRLVPCASGRPKRSPGGVLRLWHKAGHSPLPEVGDCGFGPYKKWESPCSNFGSRTMTAAEIIEQLKPLGTEQYKKVMLNHGIKEPCFGVKIEDMKKIQKQVKKDYQLALDLYETGIYDAMYLAGLIADDLKMTKKDLQKWASNAYCGMLWDYVVPWVAAESNHGRALALEWIDSKKETVAAAGWSTLRSLVSIKPDAQLDLVELKKLLDRVGKTIHQQPNAVRGAMNGFVIALGSYVSSLSHPAILVGKAIGSVSVELGTKACKVPFAPEYIEKAILRGTLKKKRKTTKC